MKCLIGIQNITLRSISDIRKVHNKEELNSLENMTLLNDLIGRQRQLAQRLAMIECGEVDYEINRDEIKKRLRE